MSAVANPRTQRGKSNSINDGEASKAPATDSPDKASSGTVNGRKDTPSYGSPQSIQPSTVDGALSTPGPTGTSQKTAGKGKSDISNTTKQSIDVLISKFDSFLQLREQDPYLRGKIPLGSSTASSRPGAKGELKYVTHPLVLNARAALMSPEGRQKKPDVANEDEKRGTKLEEILFRRRPSLRTPADSPAGVTIGNEKQGNATARKDTRPVTTANANSPAFDRTRAAGAQDSKNLSEKPTSSESPTVSFKKGAIVVPPSENGPSSPLSPSSRNPACAYLAQIPPFNPKKWNSGNSPNSPSGRNGRIENPRPSYPHTSPVASHRLEIPPYKPKSESPSRDHGHVDTSTDQSILTKVNSPRSRNETTAQIPPYQSKRAVVDDLPNGSPIAQSIVKTKNGSRTSSQITVPDIPPFKPKTQGAQQPVVNAKRETSSPTPGPSKSKHTTAKIPVEESLTQTPTTVPSKSVPQSSVLEDSTASNAHSPSGSSHKKKSDGKFDGHTSSPRVGNASNAKNTGNLGSLSTDGVSNKKQSSTSSKPPLLPTSSHSLSKSKPESESTSSPRIKESPPLDVFNSSNSPESSSPSKVTSCKGGSKPIDPRRLRLQNTWTLSYDSRTRSKAIYGNKEKYESNIQSICTFDNVADFFGVCNNVPKPSQLENNSNYQLFKNGIKPMWEDAANANGGSWTISFGRQTNSEVLNKIWMSLQCAAIGETLDPGDDICGVVLNRRGRGDRLAVWVRDGSNKRSNAEIRKRLDELLDLTSERVTVEFSLHEDYVGSGILYGK